MEFIAKTWKIQFEKVSAFWGDFLDGAGLDHLVPCQDGGWRGSSPHPPIHVARPGSHAVQYGGRVCGCLAMSMPRVARSWPL